MIKTITVNSTIITVTLFLFLNTACEHEPVYNISPKKQTDQDTVRFSKNIIPIMTTYCYGDANQRCHVTNTNQGAPGDFSQYQGLKSKVDNGSIQLRVLSPGGGMPPSYSNSPKIITEKELTDLKTWVEQGALEN